METLFGMNPEDIQAQRAAQARQQAMQFAQMSPAERATMGFYQAGNQLGGVLAGMMGAKDPQLERAATINKLVQNTDMNDLESVKGLVGQLNKVGATREAMSLLPRIDALTKTMEDRETRKADREARLEIAKSKNTSRDPSLTGDERMAKFVAEVQDKIDNGEEVSKKDLNQAKLYAEILRKQKTIVDKEGRVIGVDQRDVPTLTTAAPQGATQAAGGMRVIETPTSKKAAEQSAISGQKTDLQYETDLKNVNRAIGLIDKYGQLAAGWGGSSAFLPGVPARTLKNALSSIDAAKLISTVEALKGAGPTGATGFGSLTEKEGQYLINRIRTLDQLEDPTELKTALKEIKDYWTRMHSFKTQGAFNPPPPASPQPTQKQSTSSGNKIITDAIIQRVIEHNGGRGTREQAIRSLQKAGWTLP